MRPIMRTWTRPGSDKSKKGDFIYIAVNMHWSGHEFALPKMHPDKRWEVLLDTSQNKKDGTKLAKDEKKVLVGERSILILMSR